jgi:hypothetical protein
MRLTYYVHIPSFLPTPRYVIRCTYTTSTSVGHGYWSLLFERVCIVLHLRSALSYPSWLARFPGVKEWTQHYLLLDPRRSPEYQDCKVFFSLDTSPSFYESLSFNYSRCTYSQLYLSHYS